MPRVRINLHDIDEIEDLEEQEGWEEQLGLHGLGQRREIRDGLEARGRGDRREIRFGGAEARDRKRAERKKQIRRPSQQRV